MKIGNKIIKIEGKLITMIDSMIGQMSDGIWENNSYISRYSNYMYTFKDKETNNTFLAIDTTDKKSGFYNKTEKEIKLFIAKKLKYITNLCFKDCYYAYNEKLIKWSKNNAAEVYYLSNYEQTITVGDVYKAYQKLIKKG